VNEVVGVFLLIVNLRPPLVGVDVTHFAEDDGTSADETSALVDGCGDVSDGAFTAADAGSCCRVLTHIQQIDYKSTYLLHQGEKYTLQSSLSSK